MPKRSAEPSLSTLRSPGSMRRSATVSGQIGIFLHNAYIGEYTGVLHKRPFFGRWKNLYCFDYNIGEGRKSSFVIDAQDFGNHTRFINHSFQPNVEPVSVYCDGLVHVILYASKAIAAGTQLCYDYGKDYWKKRGKPLDLTTKDYTAPGMLL